MATSSSVQFPSKEVVSSYLRKKSVASTLDGIVTEMLQHQPEDPQKHLLDYLLKKNPEYLSQLLVQNQQQQNQHQQHHHHSPNNNNNNNNGGFSRHDSTKTFEPLAHGDGSAPRQPMPPAGESRNTTGVVLRRRSVQHPQNNNNSNNTPKGSPLSKMNASGGTPTSSNVNVLDSGCGTNLQAEELLQWILDVTDPSSNAMRNNLVPASTQQSSTSNNNTGSFSNGNHNNSSSNSVSNNTNYIIRVPAGLESHPLASRCRQLANRYHATSRILEDSAIELDSNGREIPMVKKNTSSSSSKYQNQGSNNSSTNTTEDDHNNNNNNNGTGNSLENSANLRTIMDDNNNNNNNNRRESTNEYGMASSNSQQDNSSNMNNSSPSIFSPAALSHLKNAFNLSEADHGHLLLAVTDAMRIVLDWAGDALLVAENLARVVKLLVNGERCTVFVADERAQALRTVIDGKPILVKFGQGIVGRCAVQKVPLVVNNAYAHPSFNPSVDGEVNYITRNVLSMPMMVEGKLIAVVQVLNKKESDFSDIDVEIFKAFTAVAGIVVRDAMTFPLTMRNLELAEGAKELCTQMMNVNMLHEKDAAFAWAAMLRGYLGSDCCTILRVQCNDSPDGPGRIHITQDQLELTFVACDSEIDFGGFQPLPQKEIIASALTNRNCELVNDARRDPRFDQQAARLLQHRASTSSLLVVPVFPFGVSEGSCCHYSSHYSSNVNAGSSTKHHQFASSAHHAQFCCYIVQFENFKETPDEMAMSSNNNNNTSSSQQQNAASSSIDKNTDLGRSTDELSASSANDIIFSEEAIEHVGRILPFFETVLRTMSLIHAQRHQSILLHETARAISTLCDGSMEVTDAFDLLAKSIEQMIQRDTKRPSVLFYSKVDSEGIECLQLLPRNSIPSSNVRGGGGVAGGTSTSTTNENNNNNNKDTTNNNNNNNNKNSSAARDKNNNNNNAGSSSPSASPSPPSSAPTSQQQQQNTANRVGQTFRIKRRRSSISHLVYNSHFANEVKIPIGSGVVGTAVARSTPVYFTIDEVNDLYNEGEFGPLVPPNIDMPNCSCLVVPLVEGRMLLGAMVILRPRDDIRDRILEVLSFGHLSTGVVPNHNQQQQGVGGSSTSTVNPNSSSYYAQHHQHPSFVGHPGDTGVGNNIHNSNNNNNNTNSPLSSINNYQNYFGSTGNNLTMSSAANNSIHNQPHNWITATPDQLVEPARVDFLSILVSVAKYVLKASSTVAALARQQESLLFSGELERLAMPTTNQQKKRATPTNAGGGSVTTPGNEHLSTSVNPNPAGNSNNNNENKNASTPNASGGVAVEAASNSLLGNAQQLSASGMLNQANYSQFSFGGKKSASPMEVPLKPEMFDLLSTCEFPIFDFVDGNQPAVGLVPLVIHMFRSLNCLTPLNVDEALLSQAIIKSFRRYRDVPYHNVFHAFDVTQSLFLFIKMAKLDEVFHPAECFAILLAAVFHDIDHNGLNNAYHIKAETAFGVIASLSGQKSVLEYHHCQVAIDVINSLQLLRNTSEDDRRRVLKVFFQCILSTDMAVHREIMQQIQSTFLGEDGVTRCFDKDNAEHHDLCLKMLLKMADISNPVKDFALARRWALSVTEEFYRQGDVERLEGHEVAPMFDRQLNAELSKGQIGFITFMAGPFFNLAAKCFGEFEELTRNMDNNLSRWQKVQSSNSG